MNERQCRQIQILRGQELAQQDGIRLYSVNTNNTRHIRLFEYANGSQGPLTVVDPPSIGGAVHRGLEFGAPKWTI